jgi:D-amino-acid dehydrogenase
MSAGPNPVTFRFGIAIERLLGSRGGRVIGVETNEGVFEAGAYVLSLGTGTPYLLKPLGIHVPVYPLKGYSLTLPIADERKAPRISVTDYKRKVVYATIGGDLRVAGMADLSGRQARIDVERVDQLVSEVKMAFPGASDYREINPWCGMRPATPRGAPLLGSTRYENVWLNSGHGALGFTLGLATGRVVADLVARRAPAVPLDGFILSQ